VAWAGDKFSADIPIFDEHLEASQTRTGWTVGGGVEWAFWNNWSAKLEYDFYDFGTRSVTLTGTFVPIGGTVLTPVVVLDVKQTINAIKFGSTTALDGARAKRRSSRATKARPDCSWGFEF